MVSNTEVGVNNLVGVCFRVIPACDD